MIAYDTAYHWRTSLVNQWLTARSSRTAASCCWGAASCCSWKVDVSCHLQELSERGAAACQWPMPWSHLACLCDSPVVILNAEVCLKYDNMVLLKKSSSTTWCCVLLRFEQWHKIHLNSIRIWSSLVPLQHIFFIFFLMHELNGLVPQLFCGNVSLGHWLLISFALHSPLAAWRCCV